MTPIILAIFNIESRLQKTMIETIAWVCLIAFLTIVFVSMWYEKKAHISPCPTLPWVRKKIIGALKGRLDGQKSYKMAELGCGWGGINLILAKNFPNSSIFGYEISIFPYVFAKIRGFLGSNRIKITRSSFFEADLSGFDVIICYLSPWHMEKLKPQLAGLRPGSLIISNAFAIPGWEPAETLHTYVGMDIPIYVYVI